MKTRITIICSLLLLSFSTSAEFTTVSLAHEVALSDFRVPATPSSGVMFKTCEDCDVMTVRVTPRTQYVFNDKTMTLKEFRQAVFQIRNRADETVIVLHHLETDTVVSVSIWI